MSTARRWRIGIVGCGGIARSHVAGYRMVLGERAEIVAGCDVRRDQLHAFCEAHDIPLRFESVAEMAASGEVDVVTDATPPAARSNVVMPVLEAGRHILVEKPFANSVAEARRYVQTAEAVGSTLAVNQNLRWYEDIELAHDEVHSGRLGEPLNVMLEHYQWRPTRGWRGQEERLEIAIFSIHLLDRIRWVVGQPIEAVSAVTRRAIPNMGDPRGEVFASVQLQFAGGCTATMVSEWRAPGLAECRLRVDGTGGSLLAVRPNALADAAQVSISRGAGGTGSAAETRQLMVEKASV
ncbi:MAG TPA: Gfo/Idh/MocA family oxidoreductase, partial [Chloroflexota bacterium]|nr:Gfo/Idh/MocA family oxidoreductase [Chloroflexota bacterium]